MEKFKILIPLRDYKYYQDIKPALNYLDKEKYEIIFISYEELDNIENLYAVEKHFKNLKEAESYLVNSSISPEMYRCDPRYFFEIKSESQLIIEQANIEKYFHNFILNKNIDIIFSGAASYGIWTIPHEIGKSKKINSYRMFDFSHLNIDISQPRTWFTQDIYMESWEVGNYKFNWDDGEVESFIDNYLKGIEKDNIVLSKTAIPHRNLFYADSIFQIIKNFLRMFVRNDNASRHRLNAVYNLYKTRKIETSIEDLNFKFLIYPLNAAYDEQLLLRGTYIKDIYSSIQMLCNSLPLGVKLVIRQHPVDPGGLNYKKIKYLLSNNKNLHIVNHNIPLNKLINKSSGMITVNSTSAFDSLVNKKPVFVLGRTFYSDSKATTTVKDIRKLTQEIDSFMKQGFKIEQLNAFKDILKNIIYESYPGPYSKDSDDYNKHLGLAIKSKCETIKG